MFLDSSISFLLRLCIFQISMAVAVSMFFYIPDKDTQKNCGKNTMVNLYLMTN